MMQQIESIVEQRYAVEVSDTRMLTKEKMLVQKK
jgi:hypothetical protein